jgi:type II secretion system protein J
MSVNMKKYSRKTGFTLVEVTVASTIGAFVALVAVGSLKAVIASNEMVDENVNAAAEVRFVSNMLKRDLINFYRDVNPENMKLVGIVDESGEYRTQHLIFYALGRTNARAGEPEGDVYEVEYFLAKSDDDSVLTRRLWPNPNEDYDPGGILMAIAEDIDIFELQYYDGEEWTEEWPEDMQTFPQLIEVTIAAKPPSRGSPIMESFILNIARSAASVSSTSQTGQTQQTNEQSNQQNNQQNSQQSSGQNNSQNNGQNITGNNSFTGR